MTKRNNTHNLSEAGIKIIKELIFGRFKAYNLIQMFQFVTESLETYMKRKLLSISHNRSDNFIFAKYKGLLAYKIDKSILLSWMLLRCSLSLHLKIQKYLAEWTWK